MSLIDQAKADTQAITSNLNGFGRTCYFTAPTSETATVVGIYNQHHTAYDTEGVRINALIASICVSESLLVATYYPTRNANDEIDFTRHRVTADGFDYVCREWFMDDTVGLITLILGQWE